MTTTELSISQRTTFGKQVKALRNNGVIPGIVYGHGFEPLAVQVSLKDFEVAYKQAGESTVVQLLLDGQKHPVIIKDVARNPLNDEVLHVDFYKVRLDEKITAAIPLNFTGESPAVKDFGGVLVKNVSEVEVEGLPQNLPHAIDVDLSPLATVGSQILIKDLQLPSGIELKADLEQVVALVQAQAKEEEVAPEAAALTPEDVEVDSGKGKKEEEEPVQE